MEYISPHTRASNSTLNSSSLGHSNTLHRKKSLRKSLSRRNTISTVRSASAHSFASSVVNKASTFQSPPIRRKLLIVGDGGTGKTSMLSFYSTGLFQEVRKADHPLQTVEAERAACQNRFLTQSPTFPSYRNTHPQYLKTISPRT